MAELVTGNNLSGIPTDVQVMVAEAYAFRELVKHLQSRTDVQNIDVMNLTGFCRNCMSKWYMNGLNAQGVEQSYDDATLAVYGMPLKEWKKQHQGKATEEQLELFSSNKHLHADTSPSTEPFVLPKIESQMSVPTPLVKRDAIPLQKEGHVGHSNVCCPTEDEISLASRPVAPPRVLPGPSVKLSVGILTVSDRASAGEYEDLSGPEVEKSLREHDQADTAWSLEVIKKAVVPDELDSVKKTLEQWSAISPDSDAPICNLIITTGGTGFAPRDITPEATRMVLDKLSPALLEAVLLQTIDLEPYAMLSRAVAGIRQKTVIVNLPGRPKAVRENMAVLNPVLGQAVNQAGGGVPAVQCSH